MAYSYARCRFVAQRAACRVPRSGRVQPVSEDALAPLGRVESGRVTAANALAAALGLWSDVRTHVCRRLLGAPSALGVVQRATRSDELRI